MMAEGVCHIHDCQMEWVVVDGDPYCYPEGGYWSCEECDAEEEAAFNDPADDEFFDWDYDR